MTAAMPRVDLHQPDAPTLELQLTQPLHHDIGVAAVAAVAHVLDHDLDLSPHRLRMRAAHGINQRRLAFERHQHVGRERVPFQWPVSHSMPPPKLQ